MLRYTARRRAARLSIALPEFGSLDGMVPECSVACPPSLPEPDERAIAFEHIRIVTGAGVNLLRLYGPAVTHGVKATAVDLDGKINGSHLILRRCPEDLSHRGMPAEVPFLPHWWLLAQ